MEDRFLCTVDGDDGGVNVLLPEHIPTDAGCAWALERFAGGAFST